jgi:NAD(P)-dependent dehydrogenase (short-subunit alcohol dehydrogenase family)
MAATVLITGGGKRLGAAIARGCAAAGWRVVLHYGQSRAAADALAAELGGLAVQGDLADPAAPARIMAEARAGLDGPVSALVNSASEFTFDDPARFDPALLAHLTQVNLAAPLALARELAGQADLTAGAIVNLLDQKVANPNPDYLSYTCTKHGLAAATELLAQAFAPRVRVNAVSPGLTLKSGEQSDAEFEQVARANLLARPVGADAIAEAVVYLLGATSVTGQNLFVDSGQRFVKRDGDVMFDTVARP